MPRTKQQKIGDMAEGIAWMTETLHGKKAKRHSPNHPGEDITWIDKDGNQNAEDVKGSTKLRKRKSYLSKRQLRRKEEIESGGGRYIKRDVYVPPVMIGEKEILKAINKTILGNEKNNQSANITNKKKRKRNL